MKIGGQLLLLTYFYNFDLYCAMLFSTNVPKICQVGNNQWNFGGEFINVILSEFGVNINEMFKGILFSI